MTRLPTRRDLVLWASAAQVFFVSLLAGRYAAEGMNLVQALGAATAVLGAITVAVRVWDPKEA